MNNRFGYRDDFFLPAGKDSLLPINEKHFSTSNEFWVSVKYTALNVLAAFAFGLSTWWYMGKEAGLSFFAGYAVEQSLSVDNLFVFLMLFNYFKVPIRHQNRVLSYGIYGAVIMRGEFRCTVCFYISKPFE